MDPVRLEEKLLQYAEAGQLGPVRNLLQARINQEISLDINWTGNVRSAFGWTALHLASHFGHKDVVEELLKAGADMNLQNGSGDTALHEAALAGRKEAVLLLLRYDACATVINSKSQVPRDLTTDDEITTMLEAAERREERRLEEKLLEAARDGDSTVLSQLLSRRRPPDIHCRDLMGNTPLHCAASRRQKLCVFKLLRSGKSNILGWRSHWIVLQDGELSWYRNHLQLEQEVEKNKILTTALKDLAAKRVGSTARKSPTLSTSSEDEFYDAISGEEDCPPEGVEVSSDHSKSDSCSSHHFFMLSCFFHFSIRTSLPAPMFSRNDVCIWSILKKCIGMELSKITMPVVFNEPLSFLQRLTEYMEHTYLIHQANTSSNSIERMKCIASFAVSAVASQWERTGKPFNPLLGETFEVVRDDLGFRWMSEQVSHHPPVSAFHAEGVNSDFVFHGSIYPKLKFWGKSVEAEPKGIITLELPKHNEAYTWTNPTCCVHNIIVGQLWIEQYGNVEVINHKTGERCILTFKSCGLFGKELHKVEGYILDKSKKKVCAIYGKWTECLYTVDSATFDSHKKADKKSVEEKKSNKQSSVDEEPEEMPLPEAETVQVIPGSELVWKISPRPANSAQFYAFTTFAMQLNEMDESMEQVLPRTDCRLRPDIRAMENGDIDKASAEKKRLEEKQRGARKNRSKSSDEWKTRWFQQGPNPHNGAQDWLYSGGYWDRNYAQAPDIY
uniref:Oxysterol-binding protein n=1 Tax=Denticeps clupeoides TaxID=299321 RepID=A0AAY4CQZ0_9TELE